VQARPSARSPTDREVLIPLRLRGADRLGKLCRALARHVQINLVPRDSIEQGQELFGTGQTLAFPGGLDVDERL